MDKEIRGKNIILREQREEDAEFFAFWFNQPDIMFKCGFEKTVDEDVSNIKVLSNDYALTKCNRAPGRLQQHVSRQQPSSR